MYLWRGRYQGSGSFAALREQSRRPRHSPRRTEAEREERVAALRQQTGWGAKKLHVVLRDEQRVLVLVRTIHRILERRGLLSEVVHRAAPQRWADWPGLPAEVQPERLSS